MISILLSTAYLWALLYSLCTAWGPNINNKFSANAELFIHYYSERDGRAAEPLTDANTFKDDGMGPRSRRRLVASPPLQTNLSSSSSSSSPVEDSLVEEGYYTATNVGKGRCSSSTPHEATELGSKGACIPIPFRCSRGVVDLRLDSLIAKTTPPSPPRAEVPKEECELKRAVTSGGESCGPRQEGEASPALTLREQHKNVVTTRVSALMDALLNISDSYNTKALVAGSSVFSMASGTPKPAAQGHSLAGRGPRRTHHRQAYDTSSCSGEGSSSRELLVEAHLGIATPPKTCRTPEGSRFVSVSMAVADAIGERVVGMGRTSGSGNAHEQPSIALGTSERREDDRNRDEELLAKKRRKRKGNAVSNSKEPRTRVVDTIGGRKTVVIEDDEESEHEDYGTSGDEEHPQQRGETIAIPATAATVSAGKTTSKTDGVCGGDTKEERSDKALCTDANAQNPASTAAVAAHSSEATNANITSSVSFDHLSVRGISTEDIKLLWTVVKRVHEYVSEFLFCNRKESSASSATQKSRGEYFGPFCSGEKERKRAHRMGERSLYYAPPGFYSKISAAADADAAPLLAGSGGTHNNDEENYWRLRVDGNVHGSHAVTAVLFFDSSSSADDDVVDTSKSIRSTSNSYNERIPSFSSGTQVRASSSCKTTTCSGNGEAETFEREYSDHSSIGGVNDDVCGALPSHINEHVDHDAAYRRAADSFVGQKGGEDGHCGEEDCKNNIHEHDRHLHNQKCDDGVVDMSTKEKGINGQEPLSSSSFTGGTFEFGLPPALGGNGNGDDGNNDDGLSVAPKAGRLLIFTSGKENMYHRTRVVKQGNNYAVRKQNHHSNSGGGASSLYLRSLTTAFTCDMTIGVKIGSHFEADGGSSFSSSGGGKGNNLNNNNNSSSSRGGPTDLYRVLETAIRHDPEAFRALQESTMSAVEEEARQARRAQEEKKRELPTETVVGKHRVFVRKVGSDEDDGEDEDDYEDEVYGEKSGEGGTTTDDVVLDEEGGAMTDTGN